MERMLLEHKERHPQMTLQDAVRLIYEAAYGPSAEEDPAGQIEREGNALSPEQLAMPYAESLCGDYCRMNLSVLQMLPSPVFGAMVSASRSGGEPELYRQGLEVLARMCQGGKLDFSVHKVREYLEQPPQCPPHSADYCRAWLPAYRVVRAEMARYLSLIVKISRLLYRVPQVTVAIDGQSAAGKSSLAALLKRIFDCNVFCTDDFVNDGWFDSRRFEQKVLSRLGTAKPFSLGGRRVQPRRLNVVEGLYSMHPNLVKHYQLKVYMSVSPLLQSERVLKKVGQRLFGRYAGEWIPRENAYLDHMKIALKSDLNYHDEGGYSNERAIARAVGF